jgi:hypothetical protein
MHDCPLQTLLVNIAPRCGASMWGFDVGLRCGASMWGFDVGLRCGASMWGFDVGLRCGAALPRRSAQMTHRRVLRGGYRGEGWDKDVLSLSHLCCSVMYIDQIEGRISTLEATPTICLSETFLKTEISTWLLNQKPTTRQQ